MRNTQRLIEAVTSALKSDGDLLAADQLARIEAEIAKLQTTALGDNRRHITLAMDDLEAQTKDFAARRMDKSIQRAFAGMSIDQLESSADSAKSLGETA